MSPIGDRSGLWSTDVNATKGHLEMLMPLLSVTAIGLVIGLVAGIATGRIGRGLAQAVITAWMGFVVGAFLGVIIDALLGAGTWLAWLGHAGALTAAVTGFAVRPRRETATA